MALSPLEATITGLPNDLEACHALIRDLALLLESKDADITRLKERLQEQLRQTFGRSTQKLSPGQLSLFREELEKMLQESKSCELEASGKNTQPKAGSRHGGGGRNRISPTVPRVPEHHFPSDSELICSCGEQKKEIGTEKTEQVDYVPASFKVIEHMVHTFACKKCQEGVVGGNVLRKF